MTFATIKPFILGGAAAALIATLGYTKLYLPKITFSSLYPQKGELIESVSGAGTLEAKEVIVLAPKSTSKIESLEADEGERVSRGAILARMEASELGANLREGTALIEKSRAQSASQKALIDDLKAKEALADATLSRYRNLIKGGYVTQAELDSAEAAARSARAQRLNAQEALRQSEHEIERSIGAKEALDAKHEDALLRSPVDGIVLARDAEAGSTVGAGASVFRIVDPSKVWVKIYIDERQAGGLKTGQKASVTLRSAGGKTFDATVVRIGVQSDRVTEERVVYLRLHALPEPLYIGEQAEALIQVGRHREAVIVPARALVSAQDATGVWTAQEGRAVFKPLRILGRNLQGDAAVLGIDTSVRLIVPDERVIRAGDKVRL